jgi:hypothetical protein
MAKFKRGDNIKVKFVDNDDLQNGIKVGLRGTVEDDEDDSDVPLVLFPEVKGGFLWKRIN